MNVRCPGCARVYRVNPALVPSGGIRARCTCDTVLTVAAEPAVHAMSAAAAEPEPSPGYPPVAHAPAEAVAAETVTAAPTAPEPQPPVASASSPPPAAPPAELTAGTPRPRFGAQDPDARARRIARALVSDMVVYNPERRDSALSAGTLRMEFKDEILKSWNEYVEQVGEEAARGTAHFRNALNDLLAKGEKLF